MGLNGNKVALIEKLLVGIMLVLFSQPYTIFYVVHSRSLAENKHRFAMEDWKQNGDLSTGDT